MSPVEIPVKKSSLRGAYNPSRFVYYKLCKKLGKTHRDTFAASDGGAIYVFSGDEVFILDTSGQSNT